MINKLKFKYVSYKAYRNSIKLGKKLNSYLEEVIIFAKGEY